MARMPQNETVNRVIEHARSYVGTRSRVSRVNGFGAKVGHNGKPWDGSFLETVMREISIYAGASLTSTTASLAYFHRTNRVYTQPRVGDIVYFAWSTDLFGQPHTGLVTDVSDWKKFNRFKSVEAEVNPGTPKGHEEPDGVYERIRFGTDVLAFARPAYRDIPKPDAEWMDKLPILRPSLFQFGKVSNGTVILQQALHFYLDGAARDFEKGRFDAKTRAAVLRFQREIGLLTTDGTVDDETLFALARLTGYRYFKARKLEE